MRKPRRKKSLKLYPNQQKALDYTMKTLRGPGAQQAHLPDQLVLFRSDAGAWEPCEDREGWRGTLLALGRGSSSPHVTRTPGCFTLPLWRSGYLTHSIWSGLKGGWAKSNKVSSPPCALIACTSPFGTWTTMPGFRVIVWLPWAMVPCPLTM
jgi:hypothetical protein